MWEEPQVHSNLMFLPSLVVRAPNSGDKSSLPPNCYAPSSLKGANIVHTITKFLKSFLFCPQSPNHQASVWLPSCCSLTEPVLLSAHAHVGQVSTAGIGKTFSFPLLFTCKCSVACTAELASRLGKLWLPISPRYDMCGL